MRLALRRLHRKLAPIIFFPILISATTGVAYHLGKSWFGTPDGVANFLIKIHQGEFLGEKLVPIYVLLVGFGLVTMSVTGIITGLVRLDRQNRVDSQPTTSKVRKAHWLLAAIFHFPLIVSAQTGVAYRLGIDWFGLSSEKAELFIKIHQGAYLGPTFSVFYILILGLGLISLLVTGINMTSLSKIKLPQWKLQQSSAQKLSQFTLSKAINSLRRKVWSAIAIFTILLVATLYGITSIVLSKKSTTPVTKLETQQVHHIQDLLIPIGIVALVFGISALIIAEKLIENWRRQKEIQATLYENEATSNTILKAVPDSMLHIHQDGRCLNYIPAKGTKPFIPTGDVFNKNLTEFLPKEVAQQLSECTQLALQSGLTHVYRFSISLDDEKTYQEARISAIGETEVLIMIREISDLKQAQNESENFSSINEDTAIIWLSQQELIPLLEQTLQDTKKHDRHHVLCYLAVDRQETIYSNHGSSACDNLLQEVTKKIKSHLPVKCLFARLDSNELALLLYDYSLEKISALANELRQDLSFPFLWEDKEYSINVSIGSIEIDAECSDALSIMSAANAASNIAKQKVASKTFW
jgi:GGDEF domain-containing protein